MSFPFPTSLPHWLTDLVWWSGCVDVEADGEPLAIRRTRTHVRGQLGRVRSALGGLAGRGHGDLDTGRRGLGGGVREGA